MGNEHSYINKRDEHRDIKVPAHYQGTIYVGKQLECGCCGKEFPIWEGYQDQGQDAGYGICKKCQAMEEERNKVKMTQAIDLLKDSLNNKNRAKYDAMDREQQESIVLRAFDEGLLKIHI